MKVRMRSRKRPLLPVPALLCLLGSILFTGCSAKFQPIDPLQGGPAPGPPGGPPPVGGQAGSITISPQVVALAPGQTVQFTASGTGGAQTEWLVNGTVGGGSSAGSVDSSGKYTAPANVSQSENVTVTVALTASAPQNYASAVVSIIQPGAFTCPFDLGKNPQVAQYSIYLPSPGKVSVEFGTTTAYGLNTWQVPTPTNNGGNVQLWVAGMLGDTLYHLRGQVVLNDGATYTDADQTCQTGIPPTTPLVQVTTNGKPQPGIEMWNPLISKTQNQAFATDLKGNVIWTYSYNQPQGDLIQGIQLLPNGNLLMPISYLSSLTTAQQPTNAYNEVREIDLAGDTVADLTMDQLNQKLAAGNFLDGQGNIYKLGSFHHDVLPLPNGHFVLLATYYRTVNVQAYGTLNVTGDALVDVDQNFNPDWVWNTFDHTGPGELDINRHPMNYTAQDPDWTHSNGMLYAADHNLLLSMRHQNWIIKIEFLDGKGSGKILWRLGQAGDFQFVDTVDPSGASDPANWFYAQHGMNFFSPVTSGLFRLGLMDNGNDRLSSDGTRVNCLPFKPSTPQCYSTMPVLEINESNMTATMITHYYPTPHTDSYYSFFGGNAELENNGDMEVDFCAASRGSIVQELDPSAKNVIWQGFTPSADEFHVYRLPSLYPAVQW
jgi:arylsulfate sulfotransferase